MAAPMTPISPLPFYGFTQTIATNTVEELDPQPYSNTKDVVIYNADAAETVTVAIVNMRDTPAGATVSFDWQPESTASRTPQAGDTVTIGGVVLTAVASAAPGVNEWSVPGQASTAVLTVTGYPLAGTQSILFSKVTGDDLFSLAALTGTAGGAGVNEFDMTAGSANAVAASIAAAVNNLANAYAPQYVWATVAGPAVTFHAGNDYLGTDGDGILVRTTSTGSIISPTSLTTAGGVDAANNNDFTQNFVTAVNLGTNGFAAISTAWVAGVVSPPRTVVLVAVPAGVLGNAVTLAESTAGVRITVSGANFTGGVDSLPATLSAGTLIPPESSFTFNIGPEGNRQPLATAAFWAANPGSGLGIVVEHGGAGDVDINVTYVQNRGFTGEPST